MPVASSAGCFCCKACAGQIICRLFYCKACAGRIICRLFTTRPVPVSFVCRLCLLQGLCRPLHLPAVFTTMPVPVCFTTGPFCYNGLVLPCHALSACLCHDLMPAALGLAFAPVHCHVCRDHRALSRDCPVGNRITGLHWQPVHRCVCLSQNHRACCRDCSVGSRITGLHWQPVHRLCSLRSFQRGRPRTACEQPIHSLSPALFHKPETA